MAAAIRDFDDFDFVTGEAPAWEMFTPGASSYEGAGHPYELLLRSPWMVLGDKSAASSKKRS